MALVNRLDDLSDVAKMELVRFLEPFLTAGRIGTGDGLQGPAGPPGAQGPPGADGADGASGDDLLTLFEDALTAKIDANTSGDHTVVAAVTAKRIRVINYAWQAADAVTVKWYSASSGGTALTGGMTELETTGVSAALGAHMTTVAGQALVMNLSDAIQVGGELGYILID